MKFLPLTAALCGLAVTPFANGMNLHYPLVKNSTVHDGTIGTASSGVGPFTVSDVMIVNPTNSSIIAPVSATPTSIQDDQFKGMNDGSDSSETGGCHAVEPTTVFVSTTVTEYVTETPAESTSNNAFLFHVSGGSTSWLDKTPPSYALATVFKTTTMVILPTSSGALDGTLTLTHTNTEMNTTPADEVTETPEEDSTVTVTSSSITTLSVEQVSTASAYLEPIILSGSEDETTVSPFPGFDLSSTTTTTITTVDGGQTLTRTKEPDVEATTVIESTVTEDITETVRRPTSNGTSAASSTSLNEMSDTTTVTTSLEIVQTATVTMTRSFPVTEQDSSSVVPPEIPTEVAKNHNSTISSNMTSSTEVDAGFSSVSSNLASVTSASQSILVNLNGTKSEIQPFSTVPTSTGSIANDTTSPVLQATVSEETVLTTLSTVEASIASNLTEPSTISCSSEETSKAPEPQVYSDGFDHKSGFNASTSGLLLRNIRRKLPTFTTVVKPTDPSGTHAPQTAFGHWNQTSLPATGGPTSVQASASTVPSGASLPAADVDLLMAEQASKSHIDDCGEVGNFTVTWDDKPEALANLPPNFDEFRPIASPYHNLLNSNGYVYVPRKTRFFSWLSHSDTMTAFVPEGGARATESWDNGSHFPELAPGEIGAGARAHDTTYHFNAFGVDLACPGNDRQCRFEILGLAFNYATKVQDAKVKQVVLMAGCARGMVCSMARVPLMDEFRQVTGLHFAMFLEGNQEPQVFLMDNLRLGWADNSCEAGGERKAVMEGAV